MANWFEFRRKFRRVIQQREIAKRARPYALAVAGGSARRRGDSPLQCPHVLGTADHTAWMTGWLAEQEKRV